MLEVSFCKYYNADGDFFQEHFFKLKGVFIMQEINLEVNIMKPEDNRAILHYIADNLVCYTSLAELAGFCKMYAAKYDFIMMSKGDK
jgi:hypothetical protein